MGYLRSISNKQPLLGLGKKLCFPRTFLSDPNLEKLT